MNHLNLQNEEFSKFDCNKKMWHMIRERDDIKIEGCQSSSSDVDEEYENFINRLYEEETQDFYMNTIFGILITIIFLWLIIR